MWASVFFQVCMSTQFGHASDGYGGRTPVLLYKRPVSPKDMGLAHRDWPLGSKVKVTNLRTGKSAVGRVIDRGPYGKVDAKGNWFNGARSKRKGTWRGCADLTPRLAKRIGHNGFEPVLLVRQ